MPILLFLIVVGKTPIISKPHVNNQIHKLEVVQKLLLYNYAKGSDLAGRPSLEASRAGDRTQTGERVRAVRDRGREGGVGLMPA